MGRRATLRGAFGLQGILNTQGQASTEYILMLMMVVTLFMTLFKGVLYPALLKLNTQINQKIQSIYSGDNLHQLPFRIPK